MRWILGAAVVTAREAVTFLAVAFVAVMRKGYSQNNFLLPPRWKEVAGPSGPGTDREMPVVRPKL